MKNNAEILISLPLQGKVSVTAIGKGKPKVKVVEMFEEIRPLCKKIIERWYQMQFGKDELRKQIEIATQKEHENLSI